MNRIKNIAFPILICGLLIYWYLMVPTHLEIFKESLLLKVTVVTAFFFSILFYNILRTYKSQIGDIVYRFRYPILLLIGIIAIVFEISGSSIGLWGNYLNTGSYDNVLFGTSRAIRSDEFAASIPWAFSQMTDNDSSFLYVNNIVRGSNTDMFLLLNQPVLDFAILFKPAHWGYLFFGIDKGLAYTWTFRTLFLFATLFEFLMLILKRNKILSVIGALLVVFGPAVQWWTIGGAEVISFGAMAVIIAYHYFLISDYRIRFLLALLLSWCATGFVLVLYPAWQVPYLIFFVAIALYFIISNWESSRFRFTKDLPIMAVFLLVTAGSLLYCFSKSMPAIEAMLNTAYPGKRQSFGGGQFFFSMATGYPFSILYSIFGLFDERGMNVFYDFFPLGIIGSTIAWIGKKDRLSATMLLINLFFLVYLIAGFPTFLAKITLMSFTMTQRLIPIFSFINIVLLLRSIIVLENYLETRAKFIITSIMTLVIMIFALNSTMSYIEQSISVYTSSPILFSIYRLLCIICTSIILFCAIYSILSRSTGSLLSWVIIIAISAGVMVNPLRSGTDVIFQSKLVQEIKKVDDKQEGIWIVESMGYPMTNVPLFAGAPTLNSTNAYPNVELWASIDDGADDSEIYNRYAHIIIELTKESNVVFELVQPDVFKVLLPVEKLSEMGITYILSERDLSYLNSENMIFEVISTVEGKNLYRIRY
ncbi:TPA: hypothetical protein TY888_001586 [Streptococcus suis]|nr:hypothetical protein [Streptococcus suis]HEM2582765.1 hypothetical protein [Streptococcus suis]